MAARDLDPDDLVRLRDIGPVSLSFLLADSPIGLSPDGQRIAFQLRQADPDDNGYCLSMVVVPLVGASRKPLIVDRGGNLIRSRFSRGPLADYYAGSSKLITPRWSPDGRTIAFLKQDGGPVQVWLASADGSHSWRVSNAGVDVEDFRWAPNGRDIVIKTKPDLEEQRRNIAREGLTGYLYDDRWSPVASNHPWPRDTKAATFEVVGPGGEVRPAQSAERQLFDLASTASAPANVSRTARSGASVAWLTTTPGNLQQDLWTSRHGEPSRACTLPMCRGNFNGIWWSADGRDLWFFRREGWNESQIALYNWRHGATAPARISVTRDWLGGCLPAGRKLICVYEESAHPRQIVSLDAESGRIERIFDPNPDFSNLKIGKVERLEWRNNLGTEIHGDLVLPPSWHPGSAPLPLIIVQYHSRGFLRGGTNDEFPIFAFAARGFAVLSIERARFVSASVSPLSQAERNRLNYENWADRKSVMSSYATGIDLLAKRGIVDRSRVGITGMSDGTSSAQFALVNSDLFAAASLSACCEDPKTLFPLMGNYGREDLKQVFYPDYTADPPGFWDKYSIARNAETFKVPLLMQSADDEYLVTLETYTSLREKRKPVEVVVFPNEHHMKWQPAHRLAIYRRNLAWFGFWLKGDAGDFARPGEVARWTEMQTEARKEGPRSRGAQAERPEAPAE
uniref:Atxe2 family lasso peptide isopeptidase n=1 Tax=Sphingomonas sp. OTU376 TaxID=3043863 RepID=UPI00313CC72B